MKKVYLHLILLAFVAYSCGEKWIEKPKNLLSEKDMVEILVDIHISNSMFNSRGYSPNDSIKLTSRDFYYSTLRSHEVSDTLFEKSLLYYASYAKQYERMYAKVSDKLKLMNQEYSVEENLPVNIGNRSRK